MKLVPLTNSDQFAIVDDADFEMVSAFKWFLSGSHAYCTARVNKRQKAMHHLICGFPPPGLETDHKDRNGLNNQKDNLHHITHSQNMRNQGFRIGTKGVYCSKSSISTPWRAQIRVAGRKITLGYFRSEDQAKLAFKAAVLQHFNVTLP